MHAPTPRLEALLDGPSRWTQIEWHDEVTSTNDVAAAHLSQGDVLGMVVVADVQTAGRGRSGRTWEDRGQEREDASLLVSAIVAAPSVATLVPLATGLAAQDALRRAGVDAELKWPNDVLVGGAKVAGILAERHDTPTGPRVIVGIGINLDWRGARAAPDGEAWTSLAEHTGADVARWDVLGDLLGFLDTWLADLERDPVAFVAHYRARCATLGQAVTVSTPSGIVEGTASAIDRVGALVVDTDEGPVALHAGDVTHVRPS